MTADPSAQLVRQAEAQLRAGQLGEALRSVHAALALSPDQPMALMIGSVIYQLDGRFDEAERLLERGAAAHPRIGAFHAALGKLLLSQKRPGDALPAIERAALLEPEQGAHRRTLAALYEQRVFTAFSDVSRYALLACLADDALTHEAFHRAWLSLLRCDPVAAPLLRVCDECVSFPEFTARLSHEGLGRFREQPLFWAGLARFLAADTAIERGLGFLRRFLREQGQVALEAEVSLLSRLARYCFLNEYVFPPEPGCIAWDPSSAGGVALFACYEPAPPVSRAERARLAELSADADYARLLSTWLDEPAEERALAQEIPRLGAIEDAVSRAVKAQYEANPYPRWTTVAARGSVPSGGAGKRVLVAGCGTGREALATALTFPAAQVHAIDLSRASIAYAMRQARALGVVNVTFAEADLLELSGRSERYDLVTAVGVLHHLRDPAAGLDALLTLVAPRGVLRVALYSRTARAPLAEARAFIAQADLKPDAPGIRAFRAAISARPETDPLRAWLTRCYDFYSLSQCRDLVFHAEEHAFTLPEIAALLRERELSLLKLAAPSPIVAATYARRFPDDPSATRLEHWHALETEDPSIFSRMYDLWLCRAAEQSAIDPSWLNTTEP